MRAGPSALQESEEDRRAKAAYRAAMLSVRAHTQSRGYFLEALPASVRPLPLRRALAEIGGLPGGLRRRATDAAVGMLADAAYYRSTEAERLHFRAHLVSLIGVRRANELEAEIKQIATDDRMRGVLIERKAFGLPSINPPQTASHGAWGSSASAAGPLEPSQSSLDLETLVTKVRVSTVICLDFEQLASFIDPRHWQDFSSFWLQSYKVREVPERPGDFEKDPSPEEDSASSWEGYLYEHVVCDWNTFTWCEFENYLKIDFRVDREESEIVLRFSLYSCLGGQFGGLVMQGGVETDHGFIMASLLMDKSEPYDKPTFEIVAQKSIRFSDLLNRRVPDQGAFGAGQILSFMAPASVGMWMKDLITVSLYSEEKAQLLQTTAATLPASEARADEFLEGRP